MAATAAIVAAGATVASSANSIFGGSSGPSGSSQYGGYTAPQPNIYQPTNQPGQDKQFNDLQNFITSYNPYGDPNTRANFNGVFQNQFNNPYAANYQTAATGAAQNAGSQAQVNYGSANAAAGTSQSMLPYAQSLMNVSSNNPYGAAMTSGAQTGGQLLGQQGYADIANAGKLMPMAQQQAGALIPAASSAYGRMTGLAEQQASALIPYGTNNATTLQGAGNTVLNTAFDPQGALYGRTQQQVTDQVRAGLAARGIDMSGAGAGIENKALSDFNIDWQSQQLNRQISGVNAGAGALASGANQMQGAYGQATQGINAGYGQGLGALTTGYGQSLSGMDSSARTASHLGSTGAQAIAQGAAMPYGAQQTQYQNLAALYSQLGQGSQAYANVGNTAANIGNTGLNQAMMGGQLPYDTANSIYGNQYGALQGQQSGYAAGVNPYQNGITNSLNYMGYGSNASAALYGAQNSAYGQQQGANQRYNQGIAGIPGAVGSLGNNLSSLYSAFGGGTNGGGSYGGYTQPGYGYVDVNNWGGG